MFKSLSALALASAIAVTTFAGSAAPARADSDDFGKFLFGAAVLAIIASSIDDHDDDVVVVKPKKHYKQHAKRLPSACRVVVQRPNGHRLTVYTARCLSNKGYMPIGAPSCRRTAKWNGQRHTYFTAPCLRNHGFAV